MQKIRRITSVRESIKYYDDLGREITKEQYDSTPQRELDEYECPRCHNLTFGRFEPFFPVGISEWCPMCYYTEYWDKEAYDKWASENPNGKNLYPIKRDNEYSEISSVEDAQ